jgi:hippurate hydrolase
MLKSKRIVELANEISEDLVRDRRFLHQNPELGLELPVTVGYVRKRLTEMGYDVQDCGKSGLVAIAGSDYDGKVFLIRGDMDALPVKEETDLEFKSESGRMHACGHDFHTAMMLGAAKILKEVEDEIPGRVKLMFQPAEETLMGAKDMIKAGVLENPSVDAALMIHVMTGVPSPEGIVVIPPEGTCSAASDWFEIHVQGKGGHGAMPNTTIDPINVATHIYQSLQTINSREIPPSETAVLTIGMFKAGDTSNVIPDKAQMNGTIRTFNPEIRNFIKERIKDISINTSVALRAKADVNIIDGCPSLLVDGKLSREVFESLNELFDGEGVLKWEDVMGNTTMSGSEDFAFVSEKVPTIMLALSAGDSNNGYAYPQHHPKADFNEAVLPRGAAIYAYAAIKWLEENK